MMRNIFLFLIGLAAASLLMVAGWALLSLSMVTALGMRSGQFLFGPVDVTAVAAVFGGGSLLISIALVIILRLSEMEFGWSETGRGSAP
jgi:hypothetical protein